MELEEDAVHEVGGEAAREDEEEAEVASLGGQRLEEEVVLVEDGVRGGAQRARDARGGECDERVKRRLRLAEEAAEGAPVAEDGAPEGGQVDQPDAGVLRRVDKREGEGVGGAQRVGGDGDGAGRRADAPPTADLLVDAPLVAVRGVGTGGFPAAHGDGGDGRVGEAVDVVGHGADAHESLAVGVWPLGFGRWGVAVGVWPRVRFLAA